MIQLPDDRNLLTKTLRSVLARHGLTKKVLENSSLRHVVSHEYSRRQQSICIVGRMFCPELLKLYYQPVSLIPGVPVNTNFEPPVFQYSAWYFLGQFDATFWLEYPINLEAVEKHMEAMIGGAIEPTVLNCQSPREAAMYAIANPRVLLMSQSGADKVLATWAKHYKLDVLS